MAIIKCKMCGGNMEISADRAYGTCDSCGSTMTLPRAADEQRVNLFNRANHFRRQNEFDKAIAAYERILEEAPTDAEAHWGAVLSRYGIEYVEDPVSHERIPTCHRVQTDSILADPDYLSARENAPDAYAAELYEKEALQIAEIQKDILAISAQEEPYDVFLCYKESTEGGSRTKDSAIAQEIYYQLTGEGYKVFFSRITLEDKLGKQYEPYIFAALSSARVMLVIGTSPENFSAVWVKNEWSRFLALMKEDHDRLLIPCYRDMDPYDLPEELSALQSQDMSKIGFMQDLIRGVKKVLDGSQAENASSAAGPGVKSLLTRARLFLEDGDFASADEYADKVLDIDPKYAPAYIVKVQVREKIGKEEDLILCPHPLSENADYQKALRFADAQNKAVYEGYNQAIVSRLAEEERKERYDALCGQSQKTQDDQLLLHIAGEFEQLGDYLDAAQLAEECRARAQRISQERAQLEEEARLRREQAQAAAKQRQEQMELERRRHAEKERIAAEKRRKRNRKLAKRMLLALLVIAIAAGAWGFVIHPSRLYSQAREDRISGQYDQAISALQAVRDNPGFSLFSGLGGFQDADTLIIQCRADALFAQGDYIAALEIYETLDTRYQTHADDYAQMYQAAMSQQENGQGQQAIASLQAIINYSDSAAKISEFHYADAQEKLASGDLTAARAGFVLAGEHQDAREMIQAIDAYSTADALMKRGDYAAARGYFANLAILDSAEKLEACYAADYAAAQALYTGGDIAGAHDAFLAIDEYSDAAARAAQIEADYTRAAGLAERGSFDEAIALYAALGNYADSEQNGCLAHYQKGMRLWEQGDKAAAEEELVFVSAARDVQKELAELRLEIADDAAAAGQYDVAISYYFQLSQTEEVKAREYALAQTCYDRDCFEQAVRLYERLGKYELSVSKLPVARYAWADQLFAKGDYARAAEQFTLLKGSTDSAERARESTYYYGAQLMEHGNWADAGLLFESLGNYSDSAVQAKECGYQLAEADLAAGEYAQAQKRYVALGNYADSAEKARLCIYEQAKILASGGDYAGAETLYASISQYQDSAEQILFCRYEQGNACFAAGDYSGALKFYENLDYSDSDTRAAQCHCAIGRQQLAAGNREEAIRRYARAAILPEARTALYDIGKDYATVNQNERAIEALWACGNDAPALALLAELADLLAQNGYAADAAIAEYAIRSSGGEKLMPAAANADIARALLAYGVLPEDQFAQAIWYAAGEAQREAGDWDGAVAAFQNAGDYSDAKTQISATYYLEGEDRRNAGDWDGAVTAFQNAGDYSDAKTQISATFYLKGEDKRKAEDWDGAVTAFQDAGDYKDAKTQISATFYLKGETKRNAGNWSSAIAAFQDAGNYKDAKTQISATFYLKGEDKRNAGDWASAVTAFESAGDYSDAAEQIKETHYQWAQSCMKAGNYTQAYQQFVQIKGYRDVDNLLAQDENLLAAAAAARDAKFAVGNYVTFGTYPQTKAGNDNTPIEWLVLDRQGNKVLLLSRYGLDAKPYNTSNTRITWEKCTLRTWLNKDFMNRAFTAEEQAAILTTNVDNSKSQLFDFTTVSSLADKVTGGNNTQDKIFLLSYAEANKYLGVTYSNDNNTKSRVSPTAYAKAQGADTNSSYKTAEGEPAGWWWLRSPGNFQHSAANVYTDGSLGSSSVNYDDDSVRPAFWVDISKISTDEPAEDSAQAAAQPAAAEAGSELSAQGAVQPAAAEPGSEFSVGSYVTFGTYPQTKSGKDKTPIEWLVLDRDGNKVLLLSRYGLDARPYNSRNAAVTWEKCPLRTWLNKDFMNRAFTAEEQAAILTTSVDNSKSQGYSEWSTNGGNDTQDKIFLLSYAEAHKYLDVGVRGGDHAKAQAAPTAYAKARGAVTSSTENTAEGERAGWWWLRSPGIYQNYAVLVHADGSLSGDRVDRGSNSVRPAFWLNLESGIF